MKKFEWLHIWTYFINRKRLYQYVYVCVRARASYDNQPL